MPAKTATTTSDGFSADERAAMKARAEELRAEGKKGAKKADGLQATLAAICFVAAVPDGITLPDRVGDWLAVAYMALFAGAAALLGQTWAQAHLPPTRSAIIMSMEPVFAAFFAVLLGGESVGARMLLGGGMVITAMLLVELLPRRRIEAEVTHIAV